MACWERPRSGGKRPVMPEPSLPRIIRYPRKGAGSGGRGQPSLDLVDLLVVDLVGAILRPKATGVGAGAEPLAAMAR